MKNFRARMLFFIGLNHGEEALAAAGLRSSHFRIPEAFDLKKGGVAIGVCPDLANVHD